MMRKAAAKQRSTKNTLEVRHRQLRAVAGGTAACIAITLLAACSSQPARAPIDVLGDRAQSASERVAAIKAVEAEVAANPAMAETLNQALAEILWSPAQPRALRRDALSKLSKHERSLALLKTDGSGLVVREPDPVIVADLCELAAAQGWREWTPALIRVCARSGGQMDADLPGLSEQDKKLIASRDWKYAVSGEKAIAAIEAGTELNAVLWKYVVEQPEKLADASVVRRDAYTVLAQRDVSGEVRRRLIAESSPASQDGKVVVEALKAGWSDLRVMPERGEELRWLLELCNKSDKASVDWWNETKVAVAGLPAGDRLRLRHLEAIRWASVHQPDIITQSDSTSLRWAMYNRLQARSHVSRSWGSRSRPYSEDGNQGVETTKHPYPSLSEGDRICIAVIDEVLSDPTNIARLLQQAALDNADRTSEYGGLILSINNGPQTPVLYPPRAKEKRGDLEFHAPDDMIRDQTRALAHYHFHATAVQNQEAAGPSVEDLQYAAAWARGCLVFTSVGKGRLNVDYYQPSSNGDSMGVVLDLGTLTEAGFEKAR